MRKVLFTLLVGSAALASLTTLAQTPQPGSAGSTPNQAGSNSTATLADCDRLLLVLEQRRPTNPGVTTDQVRAYRTSNNPQACQDALKRVDVAAANPAKEGDTSTIVVQQPAPNVQVEQAAPQVTVQQQQPQVTVRQPQPEIIVRMPKPEVDVAMAQPQVQVTQPPPNVQVTQPQQPQVNVQPAEPRINVQQNAAANVQVQENTASPTIRYERAEPKVVINQPQGDPQVRMEAAPQQPNSGNAQAPTTTGARSGQSVTVSRLKGLYLHNARGTRLGDVERVVETADGKRFVVVGVGGFLGIGERHVGMPLENVVLAGDRLILEGIADDQLKTMPAFDPRNRDLREMQGNTTLQIATR